MDPTPVPAATPPADGFSITLTPTEPPPVAVVTASTATAPTGAELVGGAAAAAVMAAEPELPVEPVRLPRKGAGARLRNKLLGATARENWFEVVDPGTNELEECLLMSPTVKQADRIISKAMELPDKKASDYQDGKSELSLKDVTIDQAELKVQALIACLRDPETRSPLLDQTHREALLDGPMNYLYAALADEARDMLNPNISRAKKNSKKARSA